MRFARRLTRASLMSWPCCVTSKVCSYLEDLRPLSSAARSCVRADDWHEQAERLVEGATIRLPGSPKFQVRALLNKTVARRIDFMELGACPNGSIALLTLRHARGMLWRGVSDLALLHTCTSQDDAASVERTYVDLAEFVLPRNVSEAIETAIVHWTLKFNRRGYARHPPSACAIACAIEVWIPHSGGDPLVAKLPLAHDGIRCELDAQFGLMGHLDLWPPCEITSAIESYYSVRVVTSGVASRAVLTCSVEGRTDLLLACIRQICHVHNIDQAVKRSAPAGLT